jgi:hypothetical protein
MNRVASRLPVLVLVAVLSRLGHADDSTKPMPVLEISLTKTRYIVGEPLILRLVLANRSSEKIPRYFLGDDDFASMDVILTFSASDQAAVFETQIPGSGGSQVVPMAMRTPPTIEPGASWQCEQMFVPMHFLDEVYTVVPAGRYRVSAKVFLPDRRPSGLTDSSNTLEMVIANPTGDDAKARALLGPRGMAAFFLGVRGGKPKEIERLLAEYPLSTYARYARARLTLDRARHWWGTRSTSLPSDHEELRALVAEGRAYIREFPDMPLNDDILLWCARTQYAAGDKEQSVRTLQELIRDYPQSETIPTARKHLEDWQRSHPAFRTSQPASQTQPAALPEGPPKRIGVVVLPGASTKPAQ